MTKEGKLKEAIQAKLTVNLANLNQAETIKTRLEKQVDSFDVTNAYSERKIGRWNLLLKFSQMRRPYK